MGKKKQNKKRKLFVLHHHGITRRLAKKKENVGDQSAGGAYLDFVLTDNYMLNNVK